MRRARIETGKNSISKETILNTSVAACFALCIPWVLKEFSPGFGREDRGSRAGKLSANVLLDHLLSTIHLVIIVNHAIFGIAAVSYRSHGSQSFHPFRLYYFIHKQDCHVTYAIAYC